MKYLLPVLSLLMTPLAALGCGPFLADIPQPAFLAVDNPQTYAGRQKNENIALWQSSVLDAYSPEEVEEVVYGMSAEEFAYCSNGDIRSFCGEVGHVYEQRTLLLLAKELSEFRTSHRDRWYYPLHRSQPNQTTDYDGFIARALAYKGSRYADRYALQAVRAAFAGHRNEYCIHLYDSLFNRFLNDNLFKRMARGYAAGAMARMGRRHEANEIFAQLGDVASVADTNAVEFVALRNPDAPDVMDRILDNAANCDRYGTRRDYGPTAAKVLAQGNASYPGDYEFVLAESEYNHGRHAEAAARMARAMGLPFSSGDLRNHARAFNMKMKAMQGNRTALEEDVRWMANMHRSENGRVWQRMWQNIVYMHWVPVLWQAGAYEEAILFAADADYRDNSSPYASLTFQLMGSLDSHRLEQAYDRILSSQNPLWVHLRTHLRTDRDYWYELVGTLALREEDYGRAARFLGQVGEGYLNSMNIYTDGYLERNFFTPYPERGNPSSLYRGYYDFSVSREPGEDHADAKYRFALEMAKLQHTAQYGENPDRRALAALTYAIGRRNSFEECWALTQYWRGSTRTFHPQLDDSNDDFSEAEYYPWLYDYCRNEGWTATRERYLSDIEQAMAALTTDDARARALVMLNRYVTAASRYGDTPTAARLRRCCDNIGDWL